MITVYKKIFIEYLNTLTCSYLRSSWKKFDLYITSAMSSDVTMEGDVLIAKSICFEGSISATSIEVEGSVVGDLISNEKIVLSDSSSVKGNIFADHIEISEGAEIFGLLKPTSKAKIN